MTNLPSELASAFADYENDPAKRLEEHTLADAISAKAREVWERDFPRPVVGEWMAFYFMADCVDKPNGWGTYFGPTSVLPGDDGKFRESPSIQGVDEGILEYWLERAKEVSHPSLRARYADLVWDLSKPAAKVKPPIESARLAIDGYLEVVDKGTSGHAHDAFGKARRALDLALSVGDKGRASAATECILNLAHSVGSERSWNLAYECMLANKKVTLTGEQQGRILDALQKLSDDELASGRIIPFQGGEPTLTLAAHFWRKGEKESAQDFIRRYASACMPTCEEGHALVASQWLTELHNTLSLYELHEEAEEVALKLEAKAEGIQETLVRSEHRQEIDMRPVDAHIDELLDAPIDEAMAAVWFQFYPDIDEIREQAKSRSTGFISQMFGQTHVDKSGRAKAAVGSRQEDPESHDLLALAQHIGFACPFLGRTLDKFRDRFTPTAEAIIEGLEKSSLFGDHNRLLVRRGLQAYLDDDDVCAIHLLVPQIESALRNVLSALGRPIWRTPRRGSSNERHVVLLDELLRDQVFEERLSERFAVYLRVLFTDRRGWNLRNDISHGLRSGQSLGRAESDRLIHVLFGLSLLGRHDDDDDDAGVVGEDDAKGVDTQAD